MAVSTVTAAPLARPGAGFEVEFTGADGVTQRLLLAECRAARLEDARPSREFGWPKGKAHNPGWWWLATTGEHVGYESWLERDVLMALDFDPEVTAVASQPFWLHWHDGRRQRRHCPDFFARRRDDSAVVVDVRPDDRIEASDAAAFAATQAACGEAGWQFRRVGAADPVMVANMRWLSRYRQPRCAGAGGTAAALLEAFARPRALWDGAAAAGDHLAVLPVLFHLLWRHELAADLTVRLGPSALVCRDRRGGRR